MAHVEDDLPGLLNGDLRREQVTHVVAHLTDCDTCRHSLVSVAAASGVLHLSARALAARVAPSTSPAGGPASGSEQRPEEPTLPALALPGRRRRGRGSLVAAAAAVIVGFAVGGVAMVNRNTGSPAPVEPAVATAALTSTVGGSARGVVTMRQPGSGADMTISTVGLSAPGAGQFYEVWLFDPTTSKMVGIGVLAPNGKGTFRFPAALISAYRAIDISLQRDNGDPRHSSTSVLRGRYS